MTIRNKCQITSITAFAPAPRRLAQNRDVFVLPQVILEEVVAEKEAYERNHQVDLDRLHVWATSSGHIVRCQPAGSADQGVRRSVDTTAHGGSG